VVFFGLFSVAPLPPGRGLIVLFFGLFLLFSVFFSLSLPGNFSADALASDFEYLLWTAPFYEPYDKAFLFINLLGSDVQRRLS